MPDIRLQVLYPLVPNRSGSCCCGGVHICRVRPLTTVQLEKEEPTSRLSEPTAIWASSRSSRDLGRRSDADASSFHAAPSRHQISYVDPARPFAIPQPSYEVALAKFHRRWSSGVVVGVRHRFVLNQRQLWGAVVQRRLRAQSRPPRNGSLALNQLCLIASFRREVATS